MSASNPVFEINAIVADALKKHFDIIRRYMILQNEDDADKRDKLKVKFDRKADAYLNFLMTSFPLPDPASKIEQAACLAELRRVVFVNTNNYLKREALRKELYTLPPTILLQVLPVAFMRDLLCYNRIRLSPKNMTSWSVFAKNYQELVLAA